MSALNKRMVAVSSNQIHNLTTTDNGLVIHRQKISQCCVVGNVLSVNEQSTKTTYEITDYTGPKLEVVLWRSNSDENKNGTSNSSGVVMEQTYVKVFGQSRKDASGHIFLVAFHIEPLSNLNDLTIHLLEVMRDVKELKRNKAELMCHSKAGSSGGMSMNDHMNQGPAISGFSEIQNLVMNLIREDQSDNGISLDQIYETLRTIKQETIKQTIQFLINEGHIYEAIDDFHFKSSN